MNTLNDLSYGIIGAVFTVHRELGPGLLESTYEICLLNELRDLGYFAERQKVLPISYKNNLLDEGYRIDILVEKQIILELKTVEEIAPIHKAQIITYLKLSKLKLGLLLNFNVKDMKQGIHRFVI